MVGSIFRILVLLVPAVGVLAFLCEGLTAGETKLLESRESIYNNIYIYERDQYVTMTFGHNRRFYTETVYDTSDELALPVTYTRYMTLALAYAREVKSVLEIGFGGGRTAWYLHKQMPEIEMLSVELDPVVVDLARKYFGIRTNEKFRVKVADGRRHMLVDETRHDVIMIDAYRGPFVPFHLLTKEFFKVVKSRLKPGGVAVQNIEPTTMMFDSALATIGEIFDHVDIYEAKGNVVAVAYDGKALSQGELKTRAQAVQDQYKLVYALPDMLSRRRVVDADLDAKVLSDDFAPVESLLAIEKYNRKLDDISQKAAQ